MKRIVFGFSLLVFVTACSDAVLIDDRQISAESPGAVEAQIVSIFANDFTPLIGDNWEGALTYLNYGSDKRSTIPVRLTVQPFAGNIVPYAVRYPGEEDANAEDAFTISNDGSQINGHPVISRRALPDGSLEIITQARGQDDNKSADIQTIYTISNRLFKLRKMVRFDSEENWIERNEFILKR